MSNRAHNSNTSMVRRALFLALSGALLWTTGCSLGDFNAPVADTDSEGGAFSGAVHGGQNPISGAAVKLWAVGSSGYGSAGILLATATTDANGNFAFQAGGATNYSCTGTPLLYLTSQGGDLGAGTNAAVSLMTILAGPTNGVTQDTCALVKAAKPTITINEVTTVASAFTLAQFFNPSAEATGTPQFGTSSTNALGLTNAFTTLGGILNLNTGTINATYQPYGALILSSSHLNVTATPEAAKIYLIADIIAACVNSSGAGSTACTELFNDAVPPPVPAATALGSGASFPTANDTLLAAYYLAVNPINATSAGTANNAKMTELYGLASATPPFATNAPQPTDWTLGLTYSSSAANGSAYLISAPSNLSIDASGNVWFLSNISATVQAVSVLNNAGGVSASGITSLAPFQGLAFDSSSNAYIARTSSTKYVYGMQLGVGTISAKYYALFDDAVSTTTVIPSAFAGDGTNMFFPQVANNYVYEVSNAAQAGTPFITSGTPATTALTAVNNTHAVSGVTTASGVAVDTASHVWLAGTSNNTLYEMTYPAYTVTTGTETTPVAYAGGAFNLPGSVAVDHSGNVWVASGIGSLPADGFVTEVPASTSVPVKDTTADHGGVNNPSGMAIDGAGNIWVSSAGQTAAFTGQTVSEFAVVGGTLTAFSPSVGFAHTYNQPGSIAIDTSGNVWIANAGIVATASMPGSVTEILGAAVPVVTPIALGVKNNTLGSLP